MQFVGATISPEISYEEVSHLSLCQCPCFKLWLAQLGQQY